MKFHTLNEEDKPACGADFGALGGWPSDEGHVPATKELIAAINCLGCKAYAVKKVAGERKSGAETRDGRRQPALEKAETLSPEGAWHEQGEERKKEVVGY